MWIKVIPWLIGTDIIGRVQQSIRLWFRRELFHIQDWPNNRYSTNDSKFDASNKKL